jgi:hypothetical protein
MNRMYLVNSFVVSLNLSSSMHAYGNMPILGVNVCQLITNLCCVLNFILCLFCYQTAVTNGTYRLHLCFRCSFVDHVFHGYCVHNQQCRNRALVWLKLNMVDLYKMLLSLCHLVWLIWPKWFCTYMLRPLTDFDETWTLAILLLTYYFVLHYLVLTADCIWVTQKKHGTHQWK